MKTRFTFVVLACVVLFMSGCGSSGQNPIVGTQDPIVGKWEAGQAGSKITAEFGNDGQAKITMLGQTLQGTYKINGGDELEWTVNGTTTKYKTKVSATELELTSEGKTVTYKKV